MIQDMIRNPKRMTEILTNTFSVTNKDVKYISHEHEILFTNDDIVCLSKIFF